MIKVNRCFFSFSSVSSLLYYKDFLKILYERQEWPLSYINCLLLNCKYRLANSRPKNNGSMKSTWPPAHGYFSISTVTPTSYTSCSMLSLFFSTQRRRRKERDQTTHTDPGLHPPPPASSSPAICAHPSACNSTTTRPWTSTEESIHHWKKRERDRDRK